MTNSLGRKHILDEAAKAVLSDRNKAYGNPEDNFRNIADTWNWWLKGKTDVLGIPPIDSRCKITPVDVAYMMILMKMARLKTNPTHADSVVDVAGYAATAGDFLPGKQDKEKDASVTAIIAEEVGREFGATFLPTKKAVL